MLSWIQVSLILCAFGLMREIRPSEPFVSEFLLGEWRNITEEQLNRDVYPVGTYSYLSLLVIVFLVTDFLRFKPVIILSGLSGIAVYSILLWTSSMTWLQASQFLYGLYMATEVAYLTYIYAKVEPSRYPRVSSFTRIAALVGRFLSGVIAQVLTHFGLMNYRDLNYITLAAQILATFWAFWLPTVQFSIYFHRKTPESDTASERKQLEPSSNERSFRSEVYEASSLILKHAQIAYTRPKVIVWSGLYACELAIFVQAQTYIQLLWIQMQGKNNDYVSYNGAVEAAQTLLGAGGAYLSSVYSPSAMVAPVAAAQGAALFLGTYFNNVFACYAGYIVMGCLFHYSITLASAKIAGQLSDESCFGLIFGINTLIGLGLQSLLTFVMVQTMKFDIYAQYYTVSGLFALLASTWLLGWTTNMIKQKKSVNLT